MDLPLPKQKCPICKVQENSKRIIPHYCYDEGPPVEFHYKEERDAPVRVPVPLL
jgi:hypothetical protein